MKKNKAEAKIMKNVIDFMIKNVAHEILYARAIDSTTVILLRIWFELGNTDLSSWKLHIIDANATDDDKALVDDIFSYLRESDTTGLTCSVKQVGTDAKVCIQLTKMET